MASSIEAGRQRDWRGLALPLAFVAAWWAATRFGWVDARLIVPPGQVAEVAWSNLRQPEFYAGLAASLWRDVAGFTLGALGGFALGASMGVSRQAERFIGPSFHTVRQISLFAWLPLVTSWLGNGDEAKILFIALSALYPVALGSFEGVRGVTRSQLEVARVHGFTRRQLVTRLIVPAASPQILTGLHLGLVYAWLATIGAEYLLPNFSSGIGTLVMRGKAAFRVELIVFGMLAIGLVGWTFNRLATRLEARALRWRSAGR
jgi:sulfonate transport system permease protein